MAKHSILEEVWDERIEHDKRMIRRKEDDFHQQEKLLKNEQSEFRKEYHHSRMEQDEQIIENKESEIRECEEKILESQGKTKVEAEIEVCGRLADHPFTDEQIDVLEESKQIQNLENEL